MLCTDASGKNTSAGRILQITKGKDYGELEFPLHPPKNVKNIFLDDFYYFYNWKEFIVLK